MDFSIQKNERQTVHTLKMMDKGQFSFQSLEDAQKLAILLAKICPVADRAVMGLSELMINAVEHGNLGISYEEKSKLNKTGKWENEVQRRLLLNENKNKQVKVEFERNVEGVKFFICDQGAGFDWKQYLEFCPERISDSHGRGIAVANSVSFDHIEYSGRGNEVHLTINTRD